MLLGVDPDRLGTRHVGVFEAPNGVLLVRSVPAGCITVAEPVTDAGAGEYGGPPGGLVPRRKLSSGYGGPPDLLV